MIAKTEVGTFQKYDRACPKPAPDNVAHRPELYEGDGFYAADNVAHPQHYARWKLEPIEFIAANDLPWWLANVIKYTMRYDAKDGLQDLRKAKTYLDMKIREVEGHERFWDKPVAEERKLNDASIQATRGR